ncbi:DUF7424 family protein [Agarivorans albus]|uniref:DUF7424 domain-containing protein n=1 Tax=Agarivorans albus MKT 106 TaxID=1331007 RepID=R9PPD7_AGAAL|nr:hypothetical protein [Agarivorans albus]GAD03148.1 hypothetical protein AALB_3228 [Agarivorans albus MKT 106]
MNLKCLLVLPILMLVGCKAELVTQLNASDINNPDSNGKVLSANMYVTLMDGCFHPETGVESDGLAEANGLMFNLFKQNHELVSCKANDDLGLEYTANYKVDVVLDTVQDKKSPESKTGMVIIANNEQGYISLQLDDNLRKRLKARTEELNMLELESVFVLNNDLAEDLEVHIPSSYVHDGKSLKAHQMFTGWIPAGKIGEFWASDVALDALRNSGEQIYSFVAKPKE